MLRVLAILIALPVAALLAYLGLAPAVPRADFVVAAEEPRTLDPQRVSWMAEIQTAAAMFEGLARLNAQTFQPEPAVAQRWEANAGQTQYTFHLRPDASWSNGAPVTAEHFRYAWLRALDPKSESQYGNLLFVIRGAEAFYRTRTNSEPADDAPAGGVGVESLNEATLRVTLERPCSYFLDLVSFITFAPLYPPAIEKWADASGQTSRRARHLWTRPGHIVCNGAFVLTEWEFKKSIRLQPNPHYWDKAGVHIGSIEIYITPDPNVKLLAYETGRIDLVRDLATPTARELLRQQRAGHREDVHVGDRFATYFYRVNCRRPPLDNPDLRKALSLAIDRRAICESVMGLGETPAFTYVPRGALRLMPRTARDGSTIYYEPRAGLGAGLDDSERIAAARESLHRSGFDRIAASRPIEIMYAPNPDYQRVAEAVQAMWESALGIRVELRVIEAKVLSERVRALDYDLVRSDWFGDYMDPSTFLDMFTATSGQNRTGWANDDYDAAIRAAAGEPDNVRRFEHLREAERILCEEQLPIIPLFFRRGNYLLSPRFEGLMDNVREILPIQRVRVVGR